MSDTRSIKDSNWYWSHLTEKETKDTANKNQNAKTVDVKAKNQKAVSVPEKRNNSSNHNAELDVKEKRTTDKNAKTVDAKVKNLKPAPILKDINSLNYKPELAAKPKATARKNTKTVDVKAKNQEVVPDRCALDVEFSQRARLLLASIIQSALVNEIRNNSSSHKAGFNVKEKGTTNKNIETVNATVKNQNPAPVLKGLNSLKSKLDAKPNATANKNTKTVDVKAKNKEAAPITEKRNTGYMRNKAKNQQTKDIHVISNGFVKNKSNRKNSVSDKKIGL